MTHETESKNINPLAQRIVRRSLKTAAALALATGAGAIGGCAMFHTKPQPAAVKDAPAAPLSPQQEAALRGQNYTAQINADMDNLDAEKFRKPGSASPTPTTQPTLADKPATTQPATAQASTQPAAVAQATTQPSPLAQATTRPAPLPAPKPIIVRVDPTFPEAMRIVRKHIAAHPTLNTALALALLDTSEGKAPNSALASALSPSDQQLLSDLLGALQGMTPISPSAALPDRAAPLIDAARQWQGHHDISIPKLVLASRVDSFGVYTPVEPKFSQGTPHTVILYCEIANFTSQKNAEGLYETKLTQQESLIASDGLIMYRASPEDVDDRSFNQRHDFYLVKKITLPDTLAIGQYTLHMDVTDRLANMLGVAKMTVEIVPSDNSAAFFGK